MIEGPIAFKVKENQFGLDLLNATTRLGRRLEYPATAGEIANIRAGAFERATQEVVDATAWRPSGRLAPYRGRHLRLGGERIGEVDAIAERDGTCLLVSCKSRVYTSASLSSNARFPDILECYSGWCCSHARTTKGTGPRSRSGGARVHLFGSGRC